VVGLCVFRGFAVVGLCVLCVQGLAVVGAAVKGLAVVGAGVFTADTRGGVHIYKGAER
jgi:hypothetical protein